MTRHRRRLGRLLPDAGHPVTADDFDQCLDAGRRRGRLSYCGGPSGLGPSWISVRVCFQVASESVPDALFLPPTDGGDQRAEQLEDTTGLQVSGPFYPGSFGNRRAVVVGDLDDHVDGSAHAGGLGMETGADADRSVRDLLGEMHPRVVRGSLLVSATTSNTSSGGRLMTMSP